MKRAVSQSQPCGAPKSAAPEAQPSAQVFSVEAVVDELDFVVAERRADIARIKRERKQPEHLKAARIEFAERMIARTQQAREVVLAAAALISECAGDLPPSLEAMERLAKALGEPAR